MEHDQKIQEKKITRARRDTNGTIQRNEQRMPTRNSKPTKPVVDRRRYTNRDPKSQSSTYIQKRRHRKIRKLQTHIPTKRHIQNLCWNYTKKD